MEDFLKKKIANVEKILEQKKKLAELKKIEAEIQKETELKEEGSEEKIPNTD